MWGGGQELFDIDEPIPLLPRAKVQVDEEENRRQKEESVGELLKTVENVSIAIPERFADPPSICEVPEELTEGSNGAYIPKVVCIGPLFDSKRKTDRMARLEHYKWCCVRKFIVGGLHPPAAAGTSESEAWSPAVHEPLLRECMDTMTRLLPRIRASYNRMSSSKDTSDEELATNVLLDGCFILQRLLKYARMAKRSSREGNDEDDDWAQLIGRKWVWGTVKRDLLVLGNQVPFFVIQKLFKHLGRKSKSNICDGERDGDNDILLYDGLQLFSSFHPRPLHASPIARHDVHHLLHLFYLSIDLPRSSPWHRDSTRGQGPPQRKSALPPDLTWWAPSAKDLDAAGVRIRARDDGTATSFLDLKFHRGVLEIRR
ncbi:hypothetical protein CFC21_053506 [Triticum aestivum]|uniref:Uncharacterized protein n=2 Tax=Triticum aestivum TaxID=4565 RepID=A0A9R1GC00_WHEAT|nr:uncharacterized protein LOC123082383 [Triticum aestivum]KAF7044249.1 hypothetical protein CFC21_053504 [Triticum aestivum]KAF7044251.1 hypothetical protein CFC21_053506 [Triticum aestivum]